MAADVDPTLRTAEPAREMLDDGFSPPHHEEPAKLMATHHLPQPDPAPADEDAGVQPPHL
jgi:hypothetical protein